GTDANAVLDGFVITAGNANGPDPNGRGGGMFNYHGGPTVTNCTFRRNNAEARGGGMFNGGEEYNYCEDPRPGYVSSGAVIVGCTFSENSAGFGAGICNGCYSSVSVTDCVFSDNSASGAGGGMDSYGRSVTATNCTFSGNLAGGGGGVSGTNGQLRSQCDSDELYIQREPGRGRRRRIRHQYDQFAQPRDQCDIYQLSLQPQLRRA
ncbi:MAG: right-handed parallel beta-helix repeat-containing protein, partial [Planctomycetota bacterium]